MMDWTDGMYTGYEWRVSTGSRWWHAPLEGRLFRGEVSLEGGTFGLQTMFRWVSIPTEPLEVF